MTLSVSCNHRIYYQEGMSDIPLYRFLKSLLFLLRSGALVRSGPRQHKPTEVKIVKYIQ
jgi:hypothetical protein